MRSSIVLGLGFGDEGKGLTVSYLVSKSKNPLVVRFSGGQQAGHTVVTNNHRHVFSNFGSGTLQGAPTYWSKYCTFCPASVMEEYEALKEFNPALYVNNLCPVTTPFDVIANQMVTTNHGTVGVGVGTTIERQEKYYKLYVQDLSYPTILEAKLYNIASYYKFDNPKTIIDDFMVVCSRLISSSFFVVCSSISEIRAPFDHIVFEGSQGILLDKDFGFFPNVTRSNTVSKNALKIVKNEGLPAPEIYYITRSYQTRHGNGFMSDERKLNLVNNENETNVPHEFQGNFRTGLLDVELINYAIRCDNNFSNGLKKNLVVTCLDQTGGVINMANGIGIGVELLPDFLDDKISLLFKSDGDSHNCIVNAENKILA